MAFCSKNSLNFETQSRRDDLISLNYILLYLHQGNLSFLPPVKCDDQFNSIKKNKNEATPESLCGQTSDMLLPFTQEVMKIGFNEEPNYHKLQFMLLKCLLEDDTILSLEFDWSYPQSNNKN